MTGHSHFTVTSTWHITPLSTPRPHRHCPACGQSRPFSCSGKVRLNANGRRLDAWLIYRCSTCDRSWNLPLLDRVAVTAVDPSDLQAMQVSDPEWVQPRAFDLTLLRRHSDRIDLPTDLAVTKSGTGAGTWDEIILDLHASRPTGQRLDRFLAAELDLPRSRLQAIARSGGLALAKDARKSLRTLVAGRLHLRLVAGRLDDRDKAQLTRALVTPDPPTDGGTLRTSR